MPRIFRRFGPWIMALLTLSAISAARAADAADYRVVDPALKVVKIDSDPHESFLALALDGGGRLFAGGREALFVYEPDAHGLYLPRHELYRFPRDTWVFDVCIRGHDLYVLTVAALYVFPEGVVKRDGLKPQRLLWGAPVAHPHQGFHGMTLGPDGDLYISLGDQAWYYGDFRDPRARAPDHWAYWTLYHGPDATATPYVGAGGVLRLSPDGRRLWVVAAGTRNECGLVFDRDWNLFGTDNDHESIPTEYVPGRFLHVTPHAYFSWPRGWMHQKQPWRSDLLETMDPNLGRYVPVGMTYYDDPFLPSEYRHCAYVARWDNEKIARYPLSRDGDTFRTAESPFLAGRDTARPVSVAVGRGGRLFAAICYMVANDASPVYKSDLVMITRADDRPDAPFDPVDETQETAAQLFDDLSSPAWSRRFRAHVEITRRGQPLLREAWEKLKSVDVRSPAATHLVWLAAADGSDEARSKLALLAAQCDSPLQCPAMRVLARFGAGPASLKVFTTGLQENDPQVRHAALIGLFDQTNELPLEQVVAAESNGGTYIRQTAAFLLARRATLGQIRSLCEDANPKRRIAGVLAAGFRLTVPQVDQAPSADVPLDLGNRQGYHVNYADGPIDLAADTRIGIFTIADAWAKRKKTAEDQDLFALLQRRLFDADPNIAKQAAFFLRLLKDDRADLAAGKVLGLPANASLDPPAIKNVKQSAARRSELAPQFTRQNWAEEAAHGDPVRGKQLFQARGCGNCHAVQEGDKGGGAPSLAGAGTRFNIDYLVESILLPNKVVSPLYRSTTIKLKSGDVLNGLVTSETAGELELLVPAGVHQTVKKDEIVVRRLEDQSPMPDDLITEPADLRDLLAFLLQRKQ